MGKIMAIHPQVNQRQPPEDNPFQIQNPIQQITQSHTTTNSNPHKTPPLLTRVINNTDIAFSISELNLLNKDPRYNLQKKNKHWFTNVALEAKTAINLLHASVRDYHRKQVSDQLTTLKLQHLPKNLNTRPYIP
jgi:hypothetical protein